MRKPLISSEHSLPRNAIGVLAAAILIPVAVLAKLIVMPFERPMKRSAAEVAKFLREFLDGTGGDWDWDDFVSIPIANPQLEEIRQRAAAVYPESEEDREILEHLYLASNELAQSESLPS